MAAAQAKDMIERKKQLQDQIKATETQLNDLRKQLAELR
jgi:phage shock protein A